MAVIKERASLYALNKCVQVFIVIIIIIIIPTALLIYVSPSGIQFPYSYSTRLPAGGKNIWNSTGSDGSQKIAIKWS